MKLNEYTPAPEAETPVRSAYEERPNRLLMPYEPDKGDALFTRASGGQAGFLPVGRSAHGMGGVRE